MEVQINEQFLLGRYDAMKSMKRKCLTGLGPGQSENFLILLTLHFISVALKLKDFKPFFFTLLNIQKTLHKGGRTPSMTYTF